MDDIRPECTKRHEESPHFLCTAVNGGTDVNFDTLDHGKMSLREREHWLAEVIVVKLKGVLLVEDWKSFFVESSTGPENVGKDIIFLVIGSPRFVAGEAVEFEGAVWVNQELLVDLDTHFWR